MDETPEMVLMHRLTAHRMIMKSIIDALVAAEAVEEAEVID